MSPLAEHAKAIRAELRTATKNGDLPKGLTFSVRSDYFSQGGEIIVRAKGYTEPLWTSAARALGDKLEAICVAGDRADLFDSKIFFLSVHVVNGEGERSF